MDKQRILAHLPSFGASPTGHFWALALVAAASLLGMVAAFGTVTPGPELPSQRPVLEQLASPSPPLRDDGEPAYLREDRVLRGDTLATLLARLGIADDEAFRFLREDSGAQAVSRQLRPGKQVSAEVSDSGELQRLVYPLNEQYRAIVVDRQGGRLQAREQALPLETRTQFASGEIRYSLFGATDDAGLPDSVANRLADIFAGDIDFHRDLRRGDRFALVFESIMHQGRLLRSGRILAAEFVNQGKRHRAFWFEDKDGKGGYYNAEGKTLRKAFLRSPLEFSRITSGFSNARFHPILQQWRAHRGVDYGAPAGTRVKSTADGVVDFVGVQGGYGKVLLLRHQNRYTTLYGHLSAFAAGLKKGARVTQGDVIGYVGATGWATGPHLHYEFRNNGIFQNPLVVALPSAPALSAQQLAQFAGAAAPLSRQLDAVGAQNLALLD